MTRAEAPWRTLVVCDDQLVFEVTRACTAGELARELLCSKPLAARAFARGQLCRAVAQGEGEASWRPGEVLARTAALAVGEVLILTFHRESAVRAGKGPVDVLYQDPILLAANKPAGLLVHGDGTASDTLTARVQGHMQQQGSSAVPQAVQRLDVETTGLVVFSLTEEFQPSLDAQVAGHDMHKRYLAVVEGSLDTWGSWRTIDAPLGRDRHDARRMRVSKTGKPSVTCIRTLALGRGKTLLLVELETGRRHQIRVHLAHVGHPLVGDALYNGRAARTGRPAPLMLHAWQEQLVHPATRETLQLQAPVPAAFAQLFPKVGELLA